MKENLGKLRKYGSCFFNVWKIPKFCCFNGIPVSTNFNFHIQEKIAIDSPRNAVFLEPQISDSWKICGSAVTATHMLSFVLSYCALNDT